MTLVFGDFNKTSLNGAIGTEVWLEAIKRTRGSGARDLKSLQAFREGMQRNRFVRQLGWRSSVFCKLTGSYWSMITCCWV